MGSLAYGIRRYNNIDGLMHSILTLIFEDCTAFSIYVAVLHSYKHFSNFHWKKSNETSKEFLRARMVDFFKRNFKVTIKRHQIMKLIANYCVLKLNCKR